jgi:hypothetical protein
MTTLNLGPANLDLGLYAGDTLNLTIDLPIDISGGIVKLQIRQRHSSSTAIVTLDSTPGGGLTVTPRTPTITESRVQIRSLTAEEENAIRATPTSAVWDIQTVLAGVTETWLAGRLTVRSDVTKATP